MVYLAEHPALALAETLVHLDLTLDLIPADYVLLEVELPDEPPSAMDHIPGDSAHYGTAWAASEVTAVLRVPTTLAPFSHNYLLNPAHRTAGHAAIVNSTPFVFDSRFFSLYAPAQPRSPGGGIS